MVLPEWFDPRRRMWSKNALQRRLDMELRDTENNHQSHHHIDERKPLAFAWDGTALVAIGYREGIVTHWMEATDYRVVLTPTGDEVLDR